MSSAPKYILSENLSERQKNPYSNFFFFFIFL